MVGYFNVTHSFISVAILHGFFQTFGDAIELFVVWVREILKMKSLQFLQTKRFHKNKEIHTRTNRPPARSYAPFERKRANLSLVDLSKTFEFSHRIVGILNEDTRTWNR